MEILNVAKSRLIFSERFFGALCLQLEWKEDNNIPTAATDGKKILYNTKFFEKWQVEGTIEVIKHEIGHVFLMHNLRRGERDPGKWNIAADHVVNLLLEIGKNIPELKKILYADVRYTGMSVEQVYDLLPNEPNGVKGKVSIGEVNDLEGTPEEKQIAEHEQKVKIAHAVMVAKQEGKLPAGLKELLDKVLSERVDWKTLFQNYLTEYMKDDYSFRMPNKRYLASGFYLPNLENASVGRIVLAVDSSGSMDKKKLEKIYAEVFNACMQAKKPLRFLTCDRGIHMDREIEPEDFDLCREVEGRGGTNYSPVFERVEECDLLIYFTDGQCGSFGEKCPTYPVLWLVDNYQEFEFKPPFGDVIRLKGD